MDTPTLALLPHTGESQLKWHAGFPDPVQTKQKEPSMTRASAWAVVAEADTAVVSCNTQSTDVTM